MELLPRVLLALVVLGLRFGFLFLLQLVQLLLLHVHRLLVVRREDPQLVSFLLLLRGLHRNSASKQRNARSLQVRFSHSVICIELSVPNVHLVAVHAVNDRVVEVAVAVEDHSALCSGLCISRNEPVLP